MFIFLTFIDFCLDSTHKLHPFPWVRVWEAGLNLDAAFCFLSFACSLSTECCMTSRYFFLTPIPKSFFFHRWLIVSFLKIQDAEITRNARFFHNQNSVWSCLKPVVWCHMTQKHTSPSAHLLLWFVQPRRLSADSCGAVRRCRQTSVNDAPLTHPKPNQPSFHATHPHPSY